MRDDTNDPIGAAMRAPMRPDDYAITLPRGIERDGELETQARQWFHKAGLPQGTVAGIVAEYCRRAGAKTPDAGDALRSMARLKAEWGEAYPRKMAAAQSVLEASDGGDTMGAILQASGMAHDLWLLRTLAALGEARQEPSETGEPA